MKKLCLLVAVLIVGAALKVSASTNAFEVAVKGTITRDSGKIQITNASLLTSASHKLVLIVDTDDDDVELVQVNPSTTDIVRTILINFRTAVLSSGFFNSDLEANGSGPSGAVDDFPAGTPTFNGDIQATGKVTINPSKIVLGAKLQGVWNDPNAEPFDAEAAVFKGTLKAVAPVPVPTNF